MSTAQALNFNFRFILLHPIGLTFLLRDILVYTFCSYEKIAECLSFDTKKNQRPWAFSSISIDLLPSPNLVKLSLLI